MTEGVISFPLCKNVNGGGTCSAVIPSVDVRFVLLDWNLKLLLINSRVVSSTSDKVIGSSAIFGSDVVSISC